MTDAFMTQWRKVPDDSARGQGAVTGGRAGINGVCVINKRLKQPWPIALSPVKELPGQDFAQSEQPKQAGHHANAGTHQLFRQASYG